MQTRSNLTLALTLLVLSGLAFSYALFNEPASSSAGRPFISQLPVGSVQAAAISGAGSGLIAYYTFDEGSGSTAADTSGSGSNGTLNGSPAWVAGKIGSGALSFNGSNYVSVPSVAGSSAMTYSLWMKADSSANGGTLLNQSIFKGLAFYGGNPHKIGFLVNASYWDGAIAGQAIDDGSWHLVTGVTDGTTATLYIDGAQSAVSTVAGNSVGGGVNIGGDNGAMLGYFTGSIDDVRIYNRALSASEVSDLYAYAGGGGSGGGSSPSDTTAPTVPSGLSASAVSSSAINLSWTASTDSVGVAGYRIYRSGSQIGTSGSANYSDSGLSASTQYSYTVSAYDAAGNASAQSSSAGATTQAGSQSSDTTPPTISSVASGSLTSSSAAISWSTNESSDSQVEYGLTTGYGNSTSVNSSLVTSHSASLSGLSASTVYHYRVKSRDAAGNLATGGDNTFTTSAASQQQAGTCGTTWYVDASVSSSGNGCSWGTAWKNVTNIAGIKAGDTVYISGGPSGSSLTYNIPGNWTAVVSGSSASSRITYQIGQDSAHNGTAIFNNTGNADWISGPNNVIVSGNAGDGQKHFKLTNYGGVFEGTNITNVRLSYIDFGNVGVDNWRVMDIRGGNGIEIDHISAKITQMTADAFSYATFSGTTWDQNSLHDSTILVPNTGSGTGPDILQGWEGGVSIYNNTFTGYQAAYTGGQHQDGWQSTGGGVGYTKIYNNTFTNIANYPIFADGYYGGFNHLWIYNNLLFLNSATLQDSDPPAGIVLGPDGGALLATTPFNDIVLANNTVVDYVYGCDQSLPCGQGRSSVGLGNVTQHAATYSGIYIVNNLAINSGVASFTGPAGTPGVTVANNVALIPPSQAAGKFAHYALNDLSNDLHLTSGATSLIGAGTNMSSFFSTDRDGVARGSSWDIGAYEYTGAGGGGSTGSSGFTDVYIAQSQAGSGDGSSCSNAKAVSFFNTAANWGSGASQIGPGKTAHLCGTVSTELTFQGSGTSGSPITLLFEAGAKVSKAVCSDANTNGCINMSGRSYVIVDGGANGIVEDTANGSSFANHAASVGVLALGTSNSEIKNLLIQNIYVHTSSSDTNDVRSTSGAVFLNGAVNNLLIHDNKIHDCEFCVNYQFNASASGVQIYSNEIYNAEHAIAFGGYGGGTVSGTKIYKNYIHDYASWDISSGNYHHDGIHFYTNAGSVIDGADIYSNTFGGDPGAYLTSHVYIEHDGSSVNNVRVFNNLVLPAPSSRTGNFGLFAFGANTGGQVYNNTILCGTNAGGYGMLFSGGNTIVRNNLVSGCYAAVAFYQASPSVVLNYNAYTADTNAGYYLYSATNFSSLSAWRTATGMEANSVSSSVAGASVSTGILSTGSAAINAGANLTSLGIAALDSDKAGTARSSTASWDIGAYEDGTTGTAGGGGTQTGSCGTTWYVDAAVSSSGNGCSWGTAWKKLIDMNGVKAGDTVYISGGPSGSSQTYAVDIWSPQYPGEWGNVVNGATYKIGQDSAHNGTAIFDGLNGGDWLVQGWSNVTISGDAGDGARHFQIKNDRSGGNGTNWNGVHVSYVDFSKVPAGIDFNPAVNVEIDHSYFYITGAQADHASYGSFSGTGYDTSRFHDNLVYVPRSSVTDGIGADGLQWNGSGYSIYNNTIVSYPTSSYTGGQHQDGWQATGGSASYIKVYNNVFADLTNYCIFPEPYLGGYTHMRIYNNICYITHANNTQAIAVSGTAAKQANDVIVANNLADGYAIPFTFRDPNLYPDTGAWVNSRFYNNVSVNGGTNIIDPNVTSANNASLTSTQASANFASYSALSGTSDYHLKSASTLINAGISAASYFTTDKDGISRPQSSAWDIGPYEYTGTVTGPSTYTVTVSKSGSGSGTVTSSAGGINCGSTCTSSALNSGASVTLTAAPASGSTFAGWGGACSGTGTCSVTVTSNTSVTASFNAGSVSDTTAPSVPSNITSSSVTQTGVTLSWTASSDDTAVAGYKIFRGGTQIASPTTNTYAITGLSANTLYSFTISAYDAAGNDSSLSSPYSITTASVPVTSYTVTVTKSGTGTGTVSGSGVNCGSTCTASVNSGTSVALSASPTAGSTFTGWGGACSGTGTCVKTVTSNTAVTASFTAAPDTTAPAVSITSPTLASIVSGTVSLAASASDNVGVVGVQFKLDNANLGPELTTAPYSGSWNTTSLSDGSHILKAVARDAAGNTKTSSNVTVTVSNSVADTSAPSTPTGIASASVTQTGVTLSWLAAVDNVDVAGYKLFRNGTLVAAPTANTYAVTGLSANTLYTFTVSAYDAAGNESSLSLPFSITTAAIPVVTYGLTVSKSGTGSGTVSGSGVNCGSTCSASVTSGTSVTLSADAFDGSIFSGWGGACSGTGDCVKQVSSNTLVTASFSAAPADTASGGGSSSGGGGGSTSGGSSGGGAISSPTGVFIPTVPQIPVASGSTSGSAVSCASIGSFTRSLTIGATGSDVKDLQIFLNTHAFPVSASGAGSKGSETQTFGPATTAAVARFQKANNISPAAGYFGPLTMSKVNSLLGGAQACSSAPAVSAPAVTAGSSSGSAYQFARSLALGSTGTDVTNLQNLLIARKFLIAAGPTGYYGTLTTAAVGKYQASLGIASPGIAGYGNVGPKTRAALNAGR